MTGQYRRINDIELAQILVLAGDERLRPQLEDRLKSITGPRTRVFWVDPAKFNALPALKQFNLIIVGLGDDAVHTVRLLEKHAQGKLPPFIAIDYAPGLQRAVNLMRLGALDYLSAAGVNDEVLEQSLALLGATDMDIASAFKAVPVNTAADNDVTMVNAQLDAQLLNVSQGEKTSADSAEPASSMAEVTAAAEESGAESAVDDATGVMPQVSAEQSKQQASAENTAVTGIIPHINMQTGKAEGVVIRSEPPTQSAEKPTTPPVDADELIANELERRYQDGDGSADSAIDFDNLDFGGKDTPFSGAWLSMPDQSLDINWPFSAQEMADGKARLGRYEVLEFLGVGGMASVFKVRDPDDDQLHAVKLLNPSKGEENVRKRFQQEFELLNTIRHKHVVALQEQVEDGKWIFTVMEYLPGGDLKSRIRRGVKRSEAIRYTAQIAAGLQAAHEKNVLHRDLKPANILFRSDGSLAIVDFGVAKAVDEKEKALTKEGQMVGTPYYSSPEQATGAKVDHRCDLYALGIILYEMIEGKRPFVGDTSLQVLMAHVRKPIPMLTQEWDVLNDVLARLLAKSPNDRLDNGRAVVELLNEVSPGDVPNDLLA